MGVAGRNLAAASGELIGEPDLFPADGNAGLITVLYEKRVAGHG